MTTFSIRREHRDDVSIVKLAGHIDSETASQLDRALDQILGENVTKIVFELQGVTFLSSAGLRAIVRALQATKKAGGNVHLAAISEPIEVILRTVGMLQMIKVFPTQEEAVQNF